MKIDREPYSQYNLVRDMLAAVEVIRTFDPSVVQPTATEIAANGRPQAFRRPPRPC